jgi:hypothetical protein
MAIVGVELQGAALTHPHAKPQNNYNRTIPQETPR